MSLTGKVAIVTGGSRGLGADICQQLAKRGAKVVLTYMSSSSGAEKVISDIRSAGGTAICVQADCMDRDAPRKIVTALNDAFGDKIDIIVNNAGAGDELFMKDITYDHFDKMFYTNVRFPMFLVKECLPHLQKGGRIVNISSVCARQAWTMQSAYSATKACMESLARTWALELGHDYGITVNAVMPGPLKTDMWDAMPADALKGMEDYIGKTPAAPRVGEVDDVSQIVAWLCEEGSRWVTGSTISANGGSCPT